MFTYLLEHSFFCHMIIICNFTAQLNVKYSVLLEIEFGLSSFLQIRNMPVQERNRLLHELKTKGLSIRQLARLTGLNRGVVQKV